MAKQGRLEDFKLARRRALFISEFLRDFNGAQAAIRAGYSKRGAKQIATRLLSDVDVKRILDGKVAAQLAAVEASDERILLETARIAFSNPGLKPVEQWTEDELATINGIEYLIRNVEAGDGHVDRVLKIRRESKLKALEMLARIRGMLIDRQQVEVDVNVNVVSERLKAARARLAERRALPVLPAEAEAE